MRGEETKEERKLKEGNGERKGRQKKEVIKREMEKEGGRD